MHSRPAFSSFGDTSPSQIKELLQLLCRIIGVLHRVADCPFVLIDLVIVAAFMRLVPKEMDGRVFGARDVLLGFEVLEAAGLIPTRREDVEGYLASYGVALEKGMLERGCSGMLKRG